MANDLKLAIRINADGTAAISEIKRLGGTVERAGKQAKTAQSGFATLGGGIARLATTAAAAIGVTRLAGAFTDANVEAGRLRGALETATGSVEGASAAWERLSTFAAETPYALEQSVSGFIKLKNLSLDPSIEALRSYGNTAAAMGKDLDQLIEAVADASVGEFERLKEFGIKASSQGNQVALTFRGVTTTIAKEADAIEGYLRQLGEVQFAGAMTRQMDTLGGAFSNLDDAWTQFLLSVGDAGATDAIADGVRDLTGTLNSLTDWINNDLDAAVATLQADFSLWGELVEDAATQLSAAQDAVQSFAVETSPLLALINDTETWQKQLRELPADLEYFATVAGIELDIVAQEFGVLAIDAKAVWEEIKLAAENVWDYLSREAGPTLDTVRNAFVQNQGPILGFFSSIGTYAINTFEMMKQAAAQAGAAVLSALQTGVSEQAQREHDLQLALLEEERAAQTVAATASRDAADAKITAAKQAREAKIAELENLREFEATWQAILADERAAEEQAAETASTVKAKVTPAIKGAGDAIKRAGGGAKSASEETDKLQQAVDALIRQYLPAKAAAIEFAEAQQTVEAALRAEKLTADEAATILAKLREEMEQTSTTAKTEADAWAKVWESGVERLDDAFSGLWEDLFSGGKSTLDSLKSLLTSWLAEMAHTLLTKPLVVSLSASLTGGSTGAAANLLSGGGTSGLSSLFSLSGNPLAQVGNAAYSLYSGASGLLTGLSSTAGASAALGSSAAGTGALAAAHTAGTTSAITGASTGAAAGLSGLAATGIGAGIAAAVYGISKAFEDKTKPRAQFIAQRAGGGGFEDNVYARSDALGLDFALGGKSHGVNAADYQDTLEAFAGVADVIGEFLGEEVAAKIQQSVSGAMELNGAPGLGVDTWSADTAFQHIFGSILEYGAETGDLLARKLNAQVGTLSGDADEMAAAIGDAILSVSALAETAEALLGTALGAALEITQLEQGIELLDSAVQGLGYDGEDTATTLTRLITQVDTLNTSAALTATNLEGLSSQALLGLGQTLAEAGGGVETLANNIGLYYEQFISAEERQRDTLAAAEQTVTEGFARLGRVVPATRDEFNTLVSSIEIVDAQSADLFASLIGLSGALDTVYDASESAITGFSTALTNVLGTLDATSQTIEEWGLTEQAIYQLRKDEADTLFDQLKTATDPAEIEQLAQDITALINGGWGLLDDSQKDQLQQPMLDYLDEVAALATDRLDLGRNAASGGGTEFSSMMQSLDEGLSGSASVYQEAAGQFRSAASTLAQAAQRLSEAATNFPTSYTVQAVVSEVG